PVVANARLRADRFELLAPVAIAVVRQQSLDPDAVSSEEAQRTLQEEGRRRSAFVGQDLDVAQARVVVDREVGELPSDPAGHATAIAMNAMTNPLNPSQFLGVQVDQIAGI